MITVDVVIIILLYNNMTFIVIRYKVLWIRMNHLVELLVERILCGVEEHGRRSTFDNPALYICLFSRSTLKAFKTFKTFNSLIVISAFWVVG